MNYLVGWLVGLATFAFAVSVPFVLIVRGTRTS